jgi:hypothetical protein
MFDFPADALPVWIGLGVVSAAVLGVALALPAAPPPAADRVAGAVDAVAASPHAASADVPLDRTHVSLTAHRIALRRGGAGGAAGATVPFAYGPVTPVAAGSPLHRILAGASPEAVFESPSALVAAADAARESPVTIERATRLLVRHVVWGGIDVTLVGA